MGRRGEKITAQSIDTVVLSFYNKFAQQLTGFEELLKSATNEKLRTGRSVFVQPSKQAFTLVSI